MLYVLYRARAPTPPAQHLSLYYVLYRKTEEACQKTGRLCLLSLEHVLYKTDQTNDLQFEFQNLPGISGPFVNALQDLPGILAPFVNGEKSDRRDKSKSRCIVIMLVRVSNEPPRLKLKGPWVAADHLLFNPSPEWTDRGPRNTPYDLTTIV